MKTDRVKELVKALVDILRLRNGLLSFFGVLIGAEIALYGGEFMLPVKVIIAGIAAAMITSAGNIINDYFDFKIDKINKPDRPIPSGRVSRSDALMLSFALFMIGLGLSKYVNSYCLSLAGLNSILLVIYGRYSKKMLIISNIIVSYLVASIFIFGALSAVNSIDLGSMGLRLVALLSSCAFLITISREIIKDVEDIEGDKKNYCITLPIRVGAENAKNLARVFVSYAIVLSIVPFVTQPISFDLFTYATLIISADLIFAISMTMNPTISQRVMILGMFLAMIGFFLGAVIPKL